MPASQLSDLTDPGADVLGTSQDTRGVILAQTGDSVNQAVISDNAEWWQHVGFASRPAKATPGKPSCQVFTWNQRSNDIVLASRDARCALPAGLNEGETCIYAGGPNNQGTGKILLADNGSTSTITITSNGTVIINAPSVKLGHGASDPVALAPALQSYVTSLTVLLTQIIAAVNGLAPGAIAGTPPTLASTVASTKVTGAQ